MTEASVAIRVFVKTDIISLIPTYLKRRAGDVELLQNLMKIEDFPAIRDLGHKLAGNGSMFGLDQISITGRDLELAAMNRDMPKVREQTRILMDYLAHVDIRPLEIK